MNEKIFKEITDVTEKFSSQGKTFNSAKEFYDFLKTQGVTASFDEVKNVLVYLSKQKPKQELPLETFDEITGGSQVTVKNVVKDNSKNVHFGKTIVINM